MWYLGREMNSWGTSKTTSPLIDFPLLAPMQVMKQRIRGLELQISNGVKMERGMWRGAAHGWKRGEVGGKMMKRKKILIVWHRGEGKWQLPGWTGQTGRTWCARNFAVQTIRANFRSIRVYPRVSGKISRESGTLITNKFWYENSLTKWLSTSKNSSFLTLCANLELDRWMTK